MQILYKVFQTAPLCKQRCFRFVYKFDKWKKTMSDACKQEYSQESFVSIKPCWYDKKKKKKKHNVVADQTKLQSCEK